MYVYKSFLFLHLTILGRKSVTFSGESQKTPNEDEGRSLEVPDRDKAIKFEKACLLSITKTFLLLYFQQIC